MKPAVYSALLLGLLSFSPNLYASELTIDAKAAILIDADTGQTLFEKEADLQIPPASMSKMMTIYIIFDAIKNGKLKLEDEFTISENAWRQEGSRMFVKLGDSVSVENLLHGAIIQSGNDACVALAEGLSGSVEAFVNRMNVTAEKIGLSGSTFANPTGLPDENHRMSVRDLAKLGGLLVSEFPELYKIYAKKEFTWNKIKQGNRNPLLYSFKGADGIKTGHTSEAGYGLVGSATRNDMRLISVVTGLNSDNQRKLESIKLLGYGFAEFETVKIPDDKIIAELPVYLGSEDTAKVSLKKSLNVFAKKMDRDGIKAKIHYNTPLVAPIQKGTVVGQLKITVPNSQKPITQDLVTTIDIPKAGFWKRVMTSISYLISGPEQYSKTSGTIVSDATVK